MDFYPCNIICAVISLFIYVSFRFGVDSYLRYNKNSKTFIRKNKKGLANFWMYKKLHEETDLGNVYYYNLFLLILTPAYFVISISLGWIEILRLPIAVLNFLLCCIQVPSMIFSSTYYNYEYHKKKFVVLEKNKSGRGYNSSFNTVTAVVAVIAFSIYNFVLVFQ